MPGMTADRAPLPGLIGRAGAAIYAWEIARRNRAFDRGEGVSRFCQAVVSVGNLSVGGTGKTPMVMRLVEALREAGHRPCIAMRGYKSRGGASDEAEEYRAKLGDVPIVAQPDRTAGLRAMLSRDGSIDVIVLDDGFQHRRIARDMDIVLIDASRCPLDDALLPAGLLREPVESLARADAVVITHAETAPAEAIERVEEMTAEAAPEALIGVARHVWAGLRDERDEDHLLGRLTHERALLVCAIGNPDPFVDRARAACSSVAGSIVLPDHDPYAPATVARIKAAARGADVILTTQKDWSKMSKVDGWPCPVLRPVLEIGFDRGWEAIASRMLETVRRRMADR